MYLKDHLMLISSEEPEEEEVGMSQVSSVTEEVALEEEVDLKVKWEDLDMDEVEEEEAVEADVVAVVVMVEAVE